MLPPEALARPSAPRGAGPRLLVAALATLALACASTTPSIRAAQRLALDLPLAGGGRLDPRELEGRVVVVAFLASWCFPCLGQIPVLQALQDRHPDTLRVVGVGMDLEGAQVLVPLIATLGVRFPVLVADPALRSGQSDFGLVRQLPSTFVLSPDGAKAAAFAGPATLEALEGLVRRVGRGG